MGSSKLSTASLALAIVAFAAFWSGMVTAVVGGDPAENAVLIVAAVAVSSSAGQARGGR
jgi:hypothetical protein